MNIPGSGASGLDALEVYVDVPGKHPLALLTHGTSDKPEERRLVYPWAMLPQALWFARRGYVALVIVRRGYGTSGGTQDSSSGGCRMGYGSFRDTGEASADDLREAVVYAGKNLPEVDTDTIVSAGVSTGGFAQVALTAKPPAGLKAAINFAGGRGGNGKGDLCNEGGIVDAFKDFGKHSRTPMLWIYAENDKWFPPRYAHEFQAAFEKGGGTDQFVLAPPDGEDGHHLFSHVSAWNATADAFLRDHNLLPLAAPYPAPAPPKVDPPPGLHDRGLDAFRAFLTAGPHKAFATDGKGLWGMSAGQMQQELADQRAVENCQRTATGARCQVVERGNVVVVKN